MRAVWIKLCDGTSAMEVPGGVLVSSYIEGSPFTDINGETSGGESVAMCMAFVPEAGIDCSKMDETGVGELKRPPDPSLRDPRTTDSDSTSPRVVARVLRDLAFAMRNHFRQAGCSKTDRDLECVTRAEHTAYLLTRDGRAHDLPVSDLANQLFNLLGRSLSEDDPSSSTNPPGSPPFIDPPGTAAAWQSFALSVRDLFQQETCGPQISLDTGPET